MKRYYNTNYSLLISLLLPIIFRKNILTTLLRSMINPLELNNDLFTAFVQSLDVSSYSQICYLEAMINDEFDFIDRRIEVRNNEYDFDALINWRKETDKRIVIPLADSKQRVLFSAKGHIGTNENDFEIVFPLGWTLSKSETGKLKQMVNMYKLSSKKYIIVNE